MPSKAVITYCIVSGMILQLLKQNGAAGTFEEWDRDKWQQKKYVRFIAAKKESDEVRQLA